MTPFELEFLEYINQPKTKWNWYFLLASRTQQQAKWIV